MLEPGVLFRLDCVAGTEGDADDAVAIAPHIHLDDPNDNIEGRQNSDKSPRDASDSPQAKVGTARRWFTRCDALDGRVPGERAGSLCGREMKSEADLCVTIRRGLVK